MDSAGVRGLSNGEEPSPVGGSLWPDMAAMHLAGNDMMTYHGQRLPFYGPLMVS